MDMDELTVIADLLGDEANIVRRADDDSQPDEHDAQFPTASTATASSSSDAVLTDYRTPAQLTNSPTVNSQLTTSNSHGELSDALEMEVASPSIAPTAVLHQDMLESMPSEVRILQRIAFDVTEEMEYLEALAG